LEAGWELAGTELPDIYAGQTVFAPIRTNGNRSDLKIAGKDSAGRALTLHLHPQAANNDLPKLIWMKRRIESPLQGGKAREAIALAETSNLVCRGAAFIAWDDAEEVAIAQDEVYQPSLDVPSGVACSMGSIPRAAYMPGSGVAFMPAPREALPARRSSSLKSKLTEWWSAVLDGEGPEHLTEQLTRAVESVFPPDDAKKLTSIVLGWAKHMSDKQLADTLRPLLRECERDGDARSQRKALSTFFLTLPDPWRTRASSILSALSAKVYGGTVSTSG
jgi:hypothetical protein